MAEPKQRSLTKQERAFVATIRQYYEQNGRHDLPWRKTHDPYKIAVSELMLQQTQVPRVIPKYRAFLSLFKNTKQLSEASLGEVLKAWQGLGYNRRAKYLQQATQAVQQLWQGKWPTTYEGLLSLPGIGPYTAGAIMAFAYNEPVVIIETNIRTVYLHHFFRHQTGVADTDLRILIEKTLDRENPRAWYAALMDYGTYLKATYGNASKQSAVYKKQSTFKGSNRYVRGMIIRQVSHGSTTEAVLKKALPDYESDVVSQQLAALVSEGLLVKRRNVYLLP